VVNAGADRAGALLPRSAPRQFHLLAKPTGAVCNLDCTYCFFLSKELLYPGSRFRMADDLLAAYLRQLIEAQAGAPEVVVAWQGGEPTMMGLDFFRRSVELADSLRQPGQTISYTIQTNGTLLDDDWAAFFTEHHFLVGLSIDGPRAIHDTYRVNKAGKGSFDQVMQGLAVLRRHGTDWNALTTVHAASQDYGREVYAFLRDECGARFMQFIPIVERATEQTLTAANAGWGARTRDRPLYTQQGNLVAERSVSPDGYGRFLIDIFEDWVRADIGEVYVQMFDVALANWYGEPPGLCVHSETCGLALALEHTGDVYSCDHYVEPAYRLGNIGQTHLLDLVASPRQEQFGRAKKDTLPRYCLDCDVRFACHGGCPKDRFATAPDGEPGLHYLCPSYKAFFGHIRPAMDAMCGLLRAGRAPSELASRYAAEDSRRGRNDPCPCGSGRKWKRCHQLAPATATPRLAQHA
jgi:serine-type anaerobic sulfatase-maturating enzyme